MLFFSGKENVTTINHQDLSIEELKDIYETYRLAWLKDQDSKKRNIMYKINRIMGDKVNEEYKRIHPVARKKRI